MSENSLKASAPVISFAKLVATPTDLSWAQAYNAGNFFAILSLIREKHEEIPLNSIGKDVLNNLEAEFFALSEKTIETIKTAIEESINSVPKSTLISLSICFIKENVLYVFIAGAGRVIMKRGDKIGELLEKTDTNNEVLSASGFLENKDLIILETIQFSENVERSKIEEALEATLPNDIAEVLSPAMHKTENGGLGAVIVNYQGISHQADTKDEPTIEDEVKKQELQIADDEDGGIETEDEKITEEKSYENESLDADVIRPDNPSAEYATPDADPDPRLFGSSKQIQVWGVLGSKFQNLNHRKKMILSVVIFILLVLVSSLILNTKKQIDQKTDAEFAAIYDPALKNYQSGIDLKSINEGLARSDFMEAENLLKANLEKFKQGSEQDNQIEDLHKKVQDELTETANVNKVEPKEITVDDNSLLGVLLDSKNAISTTTGTDGVHVLTKDAVIVDGKEIIENDDDWENPKDLSVYQGNIYILDQNNQIHKYVAGSSGFGRSDYFQTSPDISKAVSMAIDGSVWVLYSTGDVSKYTRGESDGLKISGIDQPFNNPTKIATNIDTENVYVLDKGNSRIVTLDKEGAFKSQYVADLLGKALAIDVDESGGTIKFLADKKIFEIKL